MTPEERVEQLLAARFGEAIPTTLPRSPVVFGVAEQKANADPLAGRSLPEAWRKISGEYQYREKREALIVMETRIAAWAISRLLGDGWSYRISQHQQYEIVHRDGYGVRFTRCWNKDGRFRAVPLRRYKRDEGPPAEITMDSSRTFGSLAGDIRRRMIDAGLQNADEQDREVERNRKEKNRDEFQAIEKVLLAWGGKMCEGRNRESGKPTANIPGGITTLHYGFMDRGDIDLELTLPLEVAVKLGKCLKEILAEV